MKWKMEVKKMANRVGAHGIEPWTSFLSRTRSILWVGMESDHLLHSYQECVLPVNYRPKRGATHPHQPRHFNTMELLFQSSESYNIHNGQSKRNAEAGFYENCWDRLWVPRLYQKSILRSIEQEWSQNRFFENLDSFDGVASLEIKNGLLNFGNKHKDFLEAQDGTYRFNNNEWGKEVEKSISILNRISNVYKTLKSEGGLDEKGRELIQRDFYDNGSMLWAILRVEEKFKDNPDGFEQAFKNLELKEENGFADPFLGEEIFTIKAPWADTHGIWYSESVFRSRQYDNGK